MNKKRAVRSLAKAKTRRKRVGRSTEATPTSAAFTQPGAQWAALLRGSGPPGTSVTHGPAGDEMELQGQPSPALCLPLGAARKTGGGGLTPQSDVLSGSFVLR